MNHKELIAGIAAKTDLTKIEVARLMEIAVEVMSEQLSDQRTIAFQGFGAFEVKKKDERLSVHPSTQVRTLIPPKLAVSFKQSTVLKEKLNNTPRK